MHYAAPMPLDARKIERLRQWRNPVAPDLSMTGEFHKFAQDARRQAKQLGGAGDAWLAVCPPDLLARTQLGTMSRGVLTVKTTDAGVKFQVDRWLREQGERLLVERCPTLIRVKVV